MDHTRQPKVDRIACPADPALPRRGRASFRTASEVHGVGERFEATPFDVEGSSSATAAKTARSTRCSTVRSRVGVTAPAGLIVRGADTARMDRARCAGLRSVARVLAHVSRGLAAARARDGAVRRSLSLVPRRHRRDAQLARGQGHGAPECAVPGAPGSSARTVSRAEALWARIRLQSFGGPAAQSRSCTGCSSRSGSGSTSASSCARSASACSCRDRRRRSSPRTWAGGSTGERWTQGRALVRASRAVLLTALATLYVLFDRFRG